MRRLMRETECRPVPGYGTVGIKANNLPGKCRDQLLPSQQAADALKIPERMSGSTVAVTARK